ncbi:MAG: kinase/pyrophosphorylase [Anaerolineales bacterium]|nr:kinase/pyrophosphorylase [Anaerolineales bacterium]
MTERDKSEPEPPQLPIFIVSGGKGHSGEQLTRTALAQFKEADLPVIVVPHVQEVDQIKTVVDQAAETGGTIIHTLVDSKMRRTMIHLARDRNVVAIDLIGRVLSRFAKVLGQEPLGQPGEYWKIRQTYFERVEAIEYTVAHDDGRDPAGWPVAEIMLVGMSRSGKTPLSMYLSVLGWKVANLPLFADVPPPPELLQLDQRRVVGLYIEPGQLLAHRQQRQRHLGTSSLSPYTDPLKIHEEIETLRQFYRRSGFAQVNVTDKSIEESADEVIALVTRRLGLSPS